MKKLSTKPTNARDLALNVLIKVFKQKSYSNLSLNQALNDSDLSELDKALATNLVYGTIQYQLSLDYQLAVLVKTSFKQAFIRPLLLMSLYQLMFLDKIPSSAVLNESNKLAKKYGPKTSAYKVVNGILRNFLRQKPRPLPEEQLARFSIEYSLPEWLVSYFLNLLGEKRASRLFASLNQPAHNSIRVIDKQQVAQVKQQLQASGFDVEDSDLTPHNLVIKHGSIVKSSAFINGEVTIQDEAASLVVDAFNFRGDELVLDACAAPGGKTVQIAEHLPKGKVYAGDLHQNKLNLIKQNAKRLHQANVETYQLDARSASAVFKERKFDKILVDAPCSGLGLLRRKPEIRYEKSYQDIINLAKIQTAILNDVAKVLRPGGELVYSTCSITKEENEDVVSAFLQTHPDFSLVKFSVGNLNSDGTLKILPDEKDTDGFFIAKFCLRGN